MNNDLPIFSLEDVLKATAGTLVSGKPEVHVLWNFHGFAAGIQRKSLYRVERRKFDGHDFVRESSRTRRYRNFSAG